MKSELTILIYMCWFYEGYRKNFRGLILGVGLLPMYKVGNMVVVICPLFVQQYPPENNVFWDQGNLCQIDHR